MKRILLFAFLFVILSLGSTFAAEYDFKIINVDGAYETHVQGINDLNEVVGDYSLPMVIPIRGGGTLIIPGPPQGFRYKNGVFSPLQFPGSVTTSPSAINNRQQVVGLTDHGLSFLYNNKNNVRDPWRLLDIGPNFLVTGLNDRLQLVGLVASQGHGFLYDHGQLDLIAPSVPCADTLGVSVTGINNHGHIVGSYYCNGWGGFFSDDLGDTFTLFDVEGTVNVTVPLAINDAGVIAGMYFDTLLGWRPWILDNGVFSKIVISNIEGVNVGAYADIKDINKHGVIAGSFSSTVDSRYHGFVGVPKVSTSQRVMAQDSTRK